MGMKKKKLIFFKKKKIIFKKKICFRVFPKTLRNMWVAVAVFNPTISLLSLCVLPLNIVSDPNDPNILSKM